jgi:hypothetical protein
VLEKKLRSTLPLKFVGSWGHFQTPRHYPTYYLLPSSELHQTSHRVSLSNAVLLGFIPILDSIDSEKPWFSKKPPAPSSISLRGRSYSILRHWPLLRQFTCWCRPSHRYFRLSAAHSHLWPASRTHQNAPRGACQPWNCRSISAAQTTYKRGLELCRYKTRYSVKFSGYPAKP